MAKKLVIDLAETNHTDPTRWEAMLSRRSLLERRRASAKGPWGMGITWLGGLGIGVGLMYLLDPDEGRKRRARIRDQANHTARLTRETLRKAGVDVRNRLRGAAITTRHRLEHERVSDEILVERVRSAMGRYVSHPGSIEVSADHGRVTIEGPILQKEALRMLRRVRRVKGVRDVVDRLQRHQTADAVPALQGRGTLQQTHAWRRSHWTPALRVAGAGAGVGLTSFGWQQQGIARVALSGAGIALTVRSLTDMPLKRLIGVRVGPRAIDVQKDIHIHAPPEEVYGFLENFENLPRFMSHLRKVSVHGDRSHWEAAGPAGMPVHWDQQVTQRDPNRLLAWKSLPGSMIKSRGVLRLEPQEDGTTRIDVRVAYNPPAGAIGHAIAHMFGADPKQAMDDDLMRLKSLIELGKATAHGKKTVTRDELRGERQ